MKKPLHKREILERLLWKIDLFDDYEDAFNRIEVDLRGTGKPYLVSFLNAHAVNLCMNDQGYYEALMRSDLLLRDGIGVKIFLTIDGRKPGKNMNGTDFIPKLLCNKRKSKVVLAGTTELILKQAEIRLAKQHITVSRRINGFESTEYYLGNFANITDEIILLGMGMPKQEKLAIVIRDRLKVPCMVINGGAIIDFLSGKVTRAPWIVRSIGFEWFYRLLSEPRRLFKRYVVGNFIFLLNIFINKT